MSRDKKNGYTTIQINKTKFMNDEISASERTTALVEDAPRQGCFLQDYNTVELG